jgi:hypothetical protein
MISDPEFELDASAPPAPDPLHDIGRPYLAPRQILPDHAPCRDRAAVRGTSTFR